MRTMGHVLRVFIAAVWGMPGLYASDGEDRDMILGTAAGKKDRTAISEYKSQRFLCDRYILVCTDKMHGSRLGRDTCG